MSFMEYLLDYIINGYYLNYEPFGEHHTHTFKSTTEKRARKHIDDYLDKIKEKHFHPRVKILGFYEINRLKI